MDVLQNVISLIGSKRPRVGVDGEDHRPRKLLITLKGEGKAGVEPDSVPFPLERLCDDLVIEVYKHLDPGSAASLSMVSYRFKCLSETTEVWKEILYRMQCEGRDLVWNYAIRTKDLHFPLLRQIARRSYIFEQAAFGAREVQFSMLYRFCLGHYKLLRFINQRLMLTMENGAVCLRNRLTPGKLLAAFPQEEQFDLVGTYWHPEHGLFLGFVADARVCQVLRIMHTTFQERDSLNSLNYKFTELRHFVFPADWSILNMDMDFKRKQIAFPFLEISQLQPTIKLFIADLCADKGLKLETQLPVNKETAVGTNFSEDGRAVFLYSEMRGFRNATSVQLWASKSFCVDFNLNRYDLNPGVQTIQDAIRLPPIEPFPEIVRTNHFLLPHNFLSSEHDGEEQRLSVAYSRCITQQRIFGSGNTNSASGSTMVSCAFLVRNTKTKAWTIVQHYSDARNGPISYHRCAAKMQQPVLVNNMPLVAFSFNQAIWMEEELVSTQTLTQEDEEGDDPTGPNTAVIISSVSAGTLVTQDGPTNNQQGVPRSRRQNALFRRVRIATFTRPSSEDNGGPREFREGLLMHVATVHVPQQSLKRACALEIIPDAASIVVTSRPRQGENAYRVQEFRF